MPTVEELDRLQALTERLTPLTRVQRGTLIRADDWNEVVGALIEVARAVLAEERQAIVAAHEHPDQVSAGWLAPALRTLVERGPLADPAAVGRVATLERAIARLTERLDQLDGGVREVRDRVVAVSANDLKREADVTAVRRTVDGLEDARDDVLALRDTLRTVEENVRVAVEVGSRLIVDGQPLDVAALVGRVAAVEELRVRLTRPNGELLDAATFDRRLAELTTQLVTEEEFDEALATRPGVVPPEAFAPIEERLRADLTNEVTTSFDRLSGEIRTETNARLAEVNTRVTQAVADALPGLSRTVLDAARSEIQSVQDAQASLETRLTQSEAALRTEFGQQLQTLDAGIADRVGVAIDQRLEETLAPIRSELGSVARRAETLSATLAERETQLRTLETRLTTVERNVVVTRDELATRFETLLNTRLTAEREATNNDLAELDRANQTRLEEGLTGVRTDLVDMARRTAQEVATTEIGNAEVRLRDSVIENTRGELPTLVTREFEAVRPVLEANVLRNLREGPGD